MLRGACPGFEAWPEASELDNEDGAYTWVGALARYLAAEVAEGRTDELAAACATVETILDDGDDQARTFANWGFLEDLTNGNLWPTGGQTRAALLPFMGPRARDNPWVMNIEHGYPS
jgi:hypothetical protein